jgi:DNA repair exonuclease SbcCD ATPase subunit
MNKEALKIGRIEAKDFLVFKEITLDPNDRLNLLIGKNANGKTGFLKAITTALKGTSDKSVIRLGADKAILMVDIGEYKVTRQIKRAGTNTLTIKNKEGDTKGHPQEWLDNVMGISFDPVSFMLAEDKVKYINQSFRTVATPEQLIAAGVEQEVIDTLDFTANGLDVLKAAKDPYYKARTDANRTVKEKKIILDDALAKIEGFSPATYYPGAVDRLQGELDELNRQLTRAQTLAEEKEKNDKLRVSLQEKIYEAKERLSTFESDEEYARRIEVADKRTKEIDEAIRLLEKERNTVNEQWKKDNKALEDLIQCRKDYKEATESLALLGETEVVDKSAIETNLETKNTEITEAREIQKTFGFYQEIQKFTKPDYEAAKERADGLQALIEKLDGDVRTDIGRSGNMPVEILTIQDGKVYVGDKNADNMSTGEQLRAGVRILRELNKNTLLKTFFVDRMESLDDDNFAELCDEIQEGEYQFFATKVLHKGEEIPAGAKLIEDGAFVDMEKEVVNGE